MLHYSQVFLPQGLYVVLVHTDQCTGGATPFISNFLFEILESVALCFRVEKELVKSTTLTLESLLHPIKFDSILMDKPTYHV